MQRRTLMITGILLIVAAGAYAIATKPGGIYSASDTPTEANTQLTGAEIETLLTGNTIVGTWGGAKYSQFYGENEFTMYVPEGGQPDQGKWRANHDTNQYESWWESTGWTPYTLLRVEQGYAWVNGDKLEPFEVLEGKQVSW